MDAGDFDGDGLCDLAVSSVTWAYNGNSGLVSYTAASQRKVYPREAFLKPPPFGLGLTWLLTRTVNSVDA